jgi:Right handed beta helix region
MHLKNIAGIFFLLLVGSLSAAAKDYYIHPRFGDDTNSGATKTEALRSLHRIQQLKLLPGDRILLASSEVFIGSLVLRNQNGSVAYPILVESISWDNSRTAAAARIDFKSYASGILLEDCSHIRVSNINLTADGYLNADPAIKMRCGVLITNSKGENVNDIILQGLGLEKIYYENKGFQRGNEEVKSANGTQNYGWGIRVINNQPSGLISNIQIKDCQISDVSHTGIKLTGVNKNINKVTITGNGLSKTGGPGIQMSGVRDVYVAGNKVQFSGSDDDGRKWGRGSGLWTWSSSNVLIERNQFLNANGPGDSAGAHIDYNCDNIIIQYNLSANNAGGFCEILGNNYNCAYRYNVSVNDGFRIKGKNGAFQEGKILWLSGYQGEKRPRKGPVNSYIYNNTIYTDASVNPKVAFDNTSSGLVMVNNIFCLKRPAELVVGDQLKSDSVSGKAIQQVLFSNNLYLSNTTWPEKINIADSAPIFGDPDFSNPGSLMIGDYLPRNLGITKNRGVEVVMEVNGKTVAGRALDIKSDILGNPVSERPSLGAIEP